MQQDNLLQFAWALCCLLIANLPLQVAPQTPLLRAQTGIVVPKRSALISGLNQQFKLRQGLNQSSAAQAQNEASKGTKLLENLLSSRKKHQSANQQQQQQQTTNYQYTKQALYLDRHQQQILAANPSLLNPSNLPSSLLTRADGHQQQNEQLISQTNQLMPAANWQQLANSTLRLNQSLQQQLQEPLNQQQQLYRGFSLIELEVKTDADRRYIRELYANLSAALNEQAQNPNALTVSPYVDVDFWSFKYALNDQIDIMVSPKSRAFIMGQLSRAKIRHRVKIDDIQSRLDQQQQQQLPAVSSGAAQPADPSQAKSGEAQLSGRGAGATLSQRRDSDAARQASGAAPPSGAASAAFNETLFFDNYQRLADINQFLESIVERSPEIARVKVIGRSSQGRYLRVLRLGYDQQSEEMGVALSPQAPLVQEAAQLNNASSILDNFFKRHQSAPHLGSIWIDGGTHAREWISPATVLYIADRLSDNHRKCAAFFEYLRFSVSQAAAAAAQLTERASRHAPPPAQLEPDLLSGINEINSSLLGKPAPSGRQRTQLERTLELLVKSPQEPASEHNCDLQLEQLLRRYTFFIMPVLNPDGYEYSHTHNRLWRKTRSTSNHPIYRHFCLGADPNRNYDARHGATGSSTHPCSQTYAGSVPFTEPETRHQSNFVYSNRQSMKMFISFHSYSQMILLPFSHSKQLAPDHKDLESVGLAAVKAIEQTHGTLYRVGPSASILYTASGTASDWAYEKAGIKYSYTIELRDTGNYGFLLPRNQIVPTGEETFNGFLAMIGQMEKNDNLLTSKSLLINSIHAPNATLVDPLSESRFSHLSQLDHLKPLSKQNLKLGLENVIDGSSSWPDSGAGMSGVRDRRPEAAPTAAESESFDLLPESAHRIPDEPTSLENAPDSGYAFEGEGELMEPTRENIIEAAKMTDYQKLTARHDHSQRIAQSAGLTASGRNFINSPLLKSRNDLPSALKRESSNDMNETL